MAICGLGLVPDCQFDCETISAIYERFPMSMRHSRLGMMSTATALCTMSNKNWPTVISDHQQSDSMYVIAVDYGTDMIVDPVAAKLAKT
jgi:hypothetical protein